MGMLGVVRIAIIARPGLACTHGRMDAWIGLRVMLPLPNPSTKNAAAACCLLPRPGLACAVAPSSSPWYPVGPQHDFTLLDGELVVDVDKDTGAPPLGHCTVCTAANPGTVQCMGVLRGERRSCAS